MSTFIRTSVPVRGRVAKTFGAFSRYYCDEGHAEGQ
jgi:hypothetical protein